MRKSFLPAVLALLAAVSMAGCGGKNTEETQTAKEETQTAETESVKEETQTAETETVKEETQPTETETPEETAEEEAVTTEPFSEGETESGVSFSAEGEKAAAFFEEMYARLNDVTLPMFIESREVDLSDSEMTEYQTGLKSTEGVSAVVMSESMVTSVPYSLMYLVPEEGADSEELLKRVMEGIDPAKWICVQADYVCGVVLGNDIFVMMTDAEIGETVYQAAVDTAKEQGLKVGNPVRR